MNGSAGGASLYAVNRALVVGLIDEKKRAGVAIVAIVHDDEIRHLIARRAFEVTSLRPRHEGSRLI